MKHSKKEGNTLNQSLKLVEGLFKISNMIDTSKDIAQLEACDKAIENFLNLFDEGVKKNYSFLIVEIDLLYSDKLKLLLSTEK